MTKKIFLKGFLASLISFMVFTACDDKLTEITDFDTDRLFRPIGFQVTMNKTEVTFKWIAVEGAVDYTLEISEDTLFNTVAYTITTPELQYIKELAGSTKYFARVKANASDPAKASGFNARMVFTTPSENLFVNYISTMIAMNTIEVRWLPGANVTNLVLTVEDTNPQSFEITQAEAEAGYKTIASLPNAIYKVQLKNEDIVRGTVNVLVEGDVLILPDQTLSAAISAATPGQVLLLQPGAVYLTGTGTYRFDKNIKLRGITPYNLPVLAMSPGGPSATSAMFGFIQDSQFNFLRFENVILNGFTGNNPANIKIGYIFNNNVRTTVGEVSFTNCVLRNLGNTPFRVQANTNQVFDLVKFDRCTIFDIGFTSTYAVVNSNSADFINKIHILNSTIYNFRGSLVLRQNQNYQEIVIRNCNINQGMMDTGSSRLLIDTNNSACLGAGIFIQNNIFGSSGDRAAGVRKWSPAGEFIVTGNFFTTDYIDQNPIGDVNFSQRSRMIPYSGSSTALWNDPVNGDFSFKDVNFAGRGIAGDPRWK